MSNKLSSNKVNTKGVKNVKKEKFKGARNYLVFYNTIQTLGWSFLLYQIFDYYMDQNIMKPRLYDKVQWTLLIFQNLAVLEVVHATFGLVSSSVWVTLQQITSRVVLVCLVLFLTVASKMSIGFPMLLFAWSITEIIRYSNYALNLLNAVPYFLVWLRYSTFIILYPIGVTGELLCTYNAVIEVSQNQLLSFSLPNMLNFIFRFDIFLTVFMLSYIPLFPQLYLHMFSQRRKVIGGKKPKET